MSNSRDANNKSKYIKGSPKKKKLDESTSEYIKGSPKKKKLDESTRSGKSQRMPVRFRWKIMHKSKHKVKFRRIKRGDKMAKKHKTQKKVIPRVIFFRRSRVTFQTKKSLAHLRLQHLLKKLAQRKLVGMTVSSKKAILVSKRLRSTAKCLLFLSQIFMEKLAHRNLPFWNQKHMKKLAHGKLVGMTVLDYRGLVESKRPRPAEKKKNFGT